MFRDVCVMGNKVWLIMKGVEGRYRDELFSRGFLSDNFDLLNF